MGCKALHVIIFYLFRSNNKSRTEDIDLAKTNDRLVGEAWVGHPYYELIDNSTDFETKMRRLCRYYTDQNFQRINHHYLTGLSQQDYTYLMRKSSCTVTPRRGSFWWSARAWSPQWRGHGPGSGTSRSGLTKMLLSLKHFDKRILVARCTMTICLASPMGHRLGSGGVADMVPFIELTKMSFTTLDSIP